MKYQPTAERILLAIVLRSGPIHVTPAEIDAATDLISQTGQLLYLDVLNDAGEQVAEAELATRFEMQLLAYADVVKRMEQTAQLLASHHRMSVHNEGKPA